MKHKIDAKQAMQLALMKVFMRIPQEDGNTHVYVAQTIGELLEYIIENIENYTSCLCEARIEVQEGKEFIDSLVDLIIEHKGE